MRKKVIGLVMCGLLIVQTPAYADVKVKGYLRKDGTYVPPHYRSDPDSSFSNNWSTKGNMNPYTGEEGTKTSPDSYNGYDGNGFGNNQTEDGEDIEEDETETPEGWLTEEQIKEWGEANEQREEEMKKLEEQYEKERIEQDEKTKEIMKETEEMIGGTTEGTNETNEMLEQYEKEMDEMMKQHEEKVKEYEASLQSNQSQSYDNIEAEIVKEKNDAIEENAEEKIKPASDDVHAKKEKPTFWERFIDFLENLIH